MPAKLKFEYSFLPQGTVVRTGSDLEPEVNSFYLDLGNSSENGVFDHHHLTSNKEEKTTRSTASIVVNGKEKVRANFDPNYDPTKIEKCDDQEFININIICHKNPDFDCYASVFILRQYLQDIYYGTKANKESQSMFFQLLADYANVIDSGELNLDVAQLDTPYAVASVIEEVLFENRDKRIGSAENEKNLEYTNVHLASLNRGIELISCMLQGFEKKSQALLSAGDPVPRDYRALHADDIINASIFQREIQYLTNDYEKYLDDVKNRSTGVRKIKLPVISGDDIQIEEVDAIFFHTVPSCSLHKHWARTDQLNAPAKAGFIFTFIPLHDGSRYKHDLPNGERVRTSRVIIAVKEGSRVSLYGLGEALEAAEIEAEEKLIASQDINKWRSRVNVRWPNEEWCTNIDPWYDGRKSNYTIVDAPGNHYSLLSINEIMEITQDYITPRLSKNYTRHVMPFSFASDNYEEICQCFNADDYESVMISTGDHYFLPYIEEYLFDPDHEQCAYYRYGKTKMESLVEQLNFEKEILYSDLGANEISNEFKNLRLKLKFAYIALFKYGVGFMILDFRVHSMKNANDRQEKPYSLFAIEVNGETVSSITVDSLNYLNKIFDKKEVFIGKIENMIQDKIDVLGGIDTFRYATVDLLSNSLYSNKQREIAYKLSNREAISTYSLTSFTQDSNKYFYKPTTYACCYQGMKGSCMVISKNPDEQEKKSLRNRFLETEFFIFLLSLHQRYVLLNMASLLARHSKDVNEAGKKKINQLRQQFLEFIIRSWSSQITNDDVGMNIYRRWQEIHDNQVIYEEVSKQIEAFDDFNQAQMSTTLETVSGIFFPLMAFGTLYSFLAEFNKNLPVKAFGCQIIYSWVWLITFIVFQFIWLCWLKKWHPIDHLRLNMKNGFNTITTGLRTWWCEKRKSKKGVDNKRSLHDDM